MTKQTKEAITSIVVLGMSAALFVYTCFIPIKNETYLQSARVFPMLISGIMTVLSALYVLQSFRAGNVHIRADGIKTAVKGLFASHEARRIALAILFVGIYVVLGVAKGRFYISSGIFVLFILLVYVKRIKPWKSILFALLFTAACYLIFFKLFMVQLV